MAGGMMSQVTGMIPGMKKEEEVPDVAPQEGEYQEYAVSIYFATNECNCENISSHCHFDILNVYINNFWQMMFNRITSSITCEQNFY